MTSCLLSCTPDPFWKQIYSERKEFAPMSKFFPFRIDPFQKGGKNNFGRVNPLWKCIHSVSNSNTACQYTQWQWTVFYCATNHLTEERDPKSYHFVIFLRVFLMSFAVSWMLGCVMSLFSSGTLQIDVNACHGSWQDFLKQWQKVGIIWRNQQHFCQFLLC